MDGQREREVTRRQDELLAAEQTRQAAQEAPIYYRSPQVRSYTFVGSRRIRSSHHEHTSGRRP
jgi:hypothetical protein